jgi:hypothetical protein
VTEAALSLLVVVIALELWIARRVWLLSERVAKIEGRRNGRANS